MSENLKTLVGLWAFWSATIGLLSVAVVDDALAAGDGWLWASVVLGGGFVMGVLTAADDSDELCP